MVLVHKMSTTKMFSDDVGQEGLVSHREAYGVLYIAFQQSTSVCIIKQ